MAGLKTLDDTAKAAEAAAAAPDAAAQDAAVNDAQEALEVAAEDVAAPEPAAEAKDTALAALRVERDAALARADQAETDYLVQSDKLASANAELAKLAGQIKDRDAADDTAKATITKLEAQIIALGATPPAPPAELAIKRPKVGKELKLPEEGKRAKAADVLGLLGDGELLMVVLADDNARVQPFPAQVGGADLFTASGAGLLFAGAIELNQDAEATVMRHAVLMDAQGKVLSSCRLGALLLGGGGLSAMIPGNSLRFDFD